VVSTTSPAQEPADGDDAVHLSSTVRVRDADGEEEYTIVRSAEALVVRGRICVATSEARLERGDPGSCTP
jgi:transcription elongation GreA/GreB family factor